MPGNDDELSDFDVMLVEEEESICERRVVQDMQREESDDVCMERAYLPTVRDTLA